MKKARRHHPVYTATHDAWMRFLAMEKDAEKALVHLLHEIAAAARQHLHGKGGHEKRHGRHRLHALLDCHAHHTAHGVKPAPPHGT